MEIVYEKGLLSELITGKKVDNKEKVVIRYTKKDTVAEKHVDDLKNTEVPRNQKDDIAEKSPNTPAKKPKKQKKKKALKENVLEEQNETSIEVPLKARKEEIVEKDIPSKNKNKKQKKKSKKQIINEQPVETENNEGSPNENEKQNGASEDDTLHNKKKKVKKPKMTEQKVETEDDANNEEPPSEKQNNSNENGTKIDKKKGNRKEKKEKAKKLKAFQEKKDELKNNPDELARTIFVGNVPLKADKISFKKFFSKYGRVESVRFRCPPIKNINTTKKVSVIRGEYHPDRSSWNSYVKFLTEEDAIKALEVNGAVYKDHHLRVSPCKKEEKRDENRAIFIGNLSLSAEDDQLWEAFESCGNIESVRIIRDNSTGMGKGFAYVNFASSDSVQLALELEDIKINKKVIRIQPCNTKAAKKNKKNSSAKVIKPKKDRKGRNPNNENANNKRKREDDGNTEVQDSKQFKKRKVENNSREVRENGNNKNVSNSNNSFAGTKIEMKKKKKKDRGLLRKQKLAEKLLGKSK